MATSSLYTHYLLTYFRTAKILTVEEIVQVGAVAVDATTLDVVGEFQSSVWPSLLRAAPSALQREVLTDSEEEGDAQTLHASFARVLQFFLGDFEWIDSRGGKALVIVLNNHQMKRLYCGQLMIEKAVGRMDAFPQPKRLALFDNFCSLEDVLYDTYELKLRHRPVTGFRKDLQYLYFYFDLDADNLSLETALDSATALLPLLKKVAHRLKGKQFYPTQIKYE